MSAKDKIRVVQKHSTDLGFPDKECYEIQEIVTGQGHWITWPGIYATRESAQAEIDRKNKAAQK